MNRKTPVLMGRGAALFLITAVELVVFLDATVVNIALPAIGADLHLGAAGLGWVTNAYLLAFGGFMLIGGRMADLLGPRRVFAAGLAVFTIASALAGLAPSAAVLIAARALQGIGAAVVVPAQIALLHATFPEPAAHRRAFGVWSAMGAAGAATGTAAGGFLTEGFGWPSIFLINVPVGIVALALITRVLPADPSDGGATARRLDVPGAVIGTSALLLVGYAIGALGDPAARGLATVLLAAGVVLLAGFVAIEARTAYPLMPLRLFQVRPVSGSAVVNALLGAAHVPAFALLSLYLQGVWRFSPTESALAVLPVALVGIVAARTVIPALQARIGAVGILAVGLGLQAVALAWFARLPADGSYLLDLLPATLVFGVGLPAAFIGATVPAVTAVGREDTGVAAGIVNTAQRVGVGIGVTALLLLASEAGLNAAFAVAAGLAGLGGALALILFRAGQHATARQGRRHLAAARGHR